MSMLMRRGHQSRPASCGQPRAGPLGTWRQRGGCPRAGTTPSASTVTHTHTHSVLHRLKRPPHNWSSVRTQGMERWEGHANTNIHPEESCYNINSLKRNAAFAECSAVSNFELILLRKTTLVSKWLRNFFSAPKLDFNIDFLKKT